MKEIILSNLWKGISLIEFIVIVFMIIRLRKSRKKTRIKNDKLKNYKNNDIDMDALMINMHHSKKLYKELILSFLVLL